MRLPSLLLAVLALGACDKALCSAQALDARSSAQIAAEPIRHALHSAEQPKLGSLFVGRRMLNADSAAATAGSDVNTGFGRPNSPTGASVPNTNPHAPAGQHVANSLGGSGSAVAPIASDAPPDGPADSGADVVSAFAPGSGDSVSGSQTGQPDDGLATPLPSSETQIGGDSRISTKPFAVALIVLAVFVVGIAAAVTACVCCRRKKSARSDYISGHMSRTNPNHVVFNAPQADIVGDVSERHETAAGGTVIEQQ